MAQASPKGERAASRRRAKSSKREARAASRRRAKSGGRPLIGVTTYPRDGEERPRFHLPTAYVDAVRLAGGLPVLLAPGEARPAELLARLDALVFAGGGDIDAARYGGSHHESSYSVNPERDAFEFDLLAAALDAETPILAICRGLQILNVLQGGDLHSHLPDLGIPESAHRVSRLEHTHHPVRLEAGSGLASLLGTSETRVASWHHQGLRRLGQGLTAVAWAPDGTVEAAELDGAAHVVAVQWHPELQIEEGSLQRRLFGALVRLAGGDPDE